MGLISAIQFSPDGTMVVSGDVSPATCLGFHEVDSLQSSGKLFLFDVRDKKVVLPHGAEKLSADWF